jgi:hypothetical protein
MPKETNQAEDIIKQNLRKVELLTYNSIGRTKSIRFNSLRPKFTYRLEIAMYIGINVARCEYCGAEVGLPFRCNYCGKYFCEAHIILEKHNCSNAPPRTPLGSYQTKRMLAENARRREIETTSISDWKKTETQTLGNVHGHRFSVPIEAYSDEKYRDKLDRARTLSEVERILRDYRKHHRTNR